MDGKWEHVVVLGAAGKMGSGIALLLLQEMASIPGCKLTLLDANSKGFNDLRNYLKQQLIKYAERNINSLRLNYAERPDVIDNGEIIQDYVDKAMDKVSFVTSIDECRGAKMIFEAILEDVGVKSEIFMKVKAVADPDAYYFSNTSSIPIDVLQKRGKIEGKLIGFHFYNPPAIQKLLEIITPVGCNKELIVKALDIGKRLNKTIVYSNDIAGFIGNGHFIREVIEALASVENLDKTMTLAEKICVLNTMTQDFLLRPMGIFQLVDYVGLDVCQHIAKVMSDYHVVQNLNNSLIHSMISAGIKGGQNADGSQKDGFFSYEKGKPVKVYDLENQKYIPYIMREDFQALPKGHESWKSLSKDKNKKEKLNLYFKHLLNDHSLSSILAKKFLENSRKIAYGLVKDGVAKSINDVNVVLEQGFFHLYGVEDPWKIVGEER